MRSSRIARALLPCVAADAITMSPRITCRLFIISMIIVATVIESPASAFTIRQNTHPTLNDAQDLDAEESSILTAKTDFFKTNNIKAYDERYTLPVSVQTTVKDNSKDDAGLDNSELNTALILLKTSDGWKITSSPVSSVTGTDSSIQEATNVYYDNTEKTGELYEKGKSESENGTVSNVYLATRNLATGISLTSTDKTTKDHPLPNDTETAEVETTEYDTTQNKTVTKSPVKSIEPNNALYTTISIIETTLQSESLSDSSNDKNIETQTLTDKTISDTNRTNSGTVTPQWKKYTTVDRKRGNSMETGIPDTGIKNEENKASLEQIQNESTTEPLGKMMRNVLFNTATTIPSTESQQVSGSFIIEKNISHTPNSVSSESTSTSLPKQLPSRSLHLTSKRAGFLDFSAKPLNEESTTIVENIDTITNFNETEVYRRMFELESLDTDAVSEGNKNTNPESQSQLAEDVIKEELLKEEILNNEENAKQYRRQGAEKEEPKDTVSEDILKVKPIGAEKDKNAALYSVNPNYKPLKKIEVQPMKPFVRDPDDNSWRNESISSLGIVFKPKPASKSFTEVLRNKTEILFNNTLDKDSKDNEKPELRERLEKIAEVRKSKKKKVIDKFGETVYTDYEENGNSGETSSVSTPNTDTTSKMITQKDTWSDKLVKDVKTTTYPPVLEHVYIHKYKDTDEVTTKKPKKYNSILEYYDTTDEYDADYVNLSKIDLKKFTTQLQTKETPTTLIPVLTSQFTKPTTTYWPERKATLQYFPPRTSQKVNINDYDGDFIRKVNYYTLKDTTKNTAPTTTVTAPAPPVQGRLGQQNKQNVIITPDNGQFHKNTNLDKTIYLTHPRLPETSQNNGYRHLDDGSFNRAAYVIKHYKDLIDEAVKDSDYEKNVEYEPAYTQSPLKGVTVNELAVIKNPNRPAEEDDYDAQFRKDILNRFVENFNQNSERFKVDFPILYNNSIVHRKAQEIGRPALATSSTLLKRLYGDFNSATKGNSYSAYGKPCETCDNVTVELSPAYELHYYVPEEEEKEEADPRAVTLPYRYT